LFQETTYPPSESKIFDYSTFVVWYSLENRQFAFLFFVLLSLKSAKEFEKTLKAFFCNFDKGILHNNFYRYDGKLGGGISSQTRHLCLRNF